MSNDTIFILIACIDILFVYCTARMGIQWIFATVVVNLGLAVMFSPKFILIFGFGASAGNIFYACSYLAAYFIAERHGIGQSKKLPFYGAAFLLFMGCMSYLVTHFVGLPQSDVTNEAVTALFGSAAKLTFASIIGYIFAQYVNIYLYELMMHRNFYMWLRSNIANAVSQLIAGTIFFSIAFADMSGYALIQTIFVAWCVKVAIVFLGTPLLYADRYKRKNS